MKKFIVIAMLLPSVLGYAYHIEGYISNKKNLKIEDAYILNINRASHTHSNSNGYFNMSDVGIGDTIKISHLQYKEKLILIKEEHLKNTLEIILEEEPLNLSEITISNHLNTLNIITQIELQTNPVNSSQEILRIVPGLIIGQHAGGGKAEQLFLRGFDLDHGTDINITVDGMPVNMVSHAHGQGYADLHFVIPETIKNIDFGKGPYYGSKGNFTTAGYVDFQTKDRIEYNILGMELGSFNTIRTTVLLNLLENNKRNSAYLASELLLTDGPFDSPQNLNRVNLMSKYSFWFKDHSKLSFQASYLKSKWDASGQIPQRLVDSGVIGRFGAVDDTEGGNTSRTNIAFNYFKPISQDLYLKTNAFYSKYDFELYSNFTFYLNDPVYGDQIKQKEDRHIIGLNNELKSISKIGKTEITNQAGLGFRYDIINDVELSHTLNRKKVLNPIQFGNINETNIYSYFSSSIKCGKWLLNPSVRLDHFIFDYYDQLSSEYLSQVKKETAISPKFNIVYSASNNFQVFLKTGKGFHSNDSRLLLSNKVKNAIPAAYGADIGFIWKPYPKLLLNTSLWYLYLQQEFVYVGDEGIVEPSGKTKRYGLDMGLNYQILDWLYFNFDINYAYARSIEEKKGEDFIPLAPEFTSAGGLNFKHNSGFAGSIKYRYISDRPANENNSIIAKGYFITDFNLSYSYKHWTFEIMVENLFDTEWNETQFATESKLMNETIPVEEIHFIPGIPFSLRAKVSFKF